MASGGETFAEPPLFISLLWREESFQEGNNLFENTTIFSTTQQSFPKHNNLFKYYFRKEFEGLIRFPNGRKHSKTQGYWPSFVLFLSGNLMIAEARGLEITSLTKKICRNYHFNKFFAFKYFLWDMECEPVTYLLFAGLWYCFICIQWHVVTQLFLSFERAHCFAMQMAEYRFRPLKTQWRRYLNI